MVVLVLLAHCHGLQGDLNGTNVNVISCIFALPAVRSQKVYTVSKIIHFHYSLLTVRFYVEEYNARFKKEKSVAL